MFLVLMIFGNLVCVLVAVLRFLILAFSGFDEFGKLLVLKFVLGF